MSLYQIVVKADYNDAIQMRNIHHYEFSGYVPDATQLQEFVDGVDAAYKSRLQSIFNQLIDVNAYGVRRVDVGEQPEADFIPTAGGWTASNAANSMPSHIAAIVSFKAATAYPRSTRTYLFPFSEDTNDANGTLTTGALLSMVNWGQDMLEISITAGSNAIKVAAEYAGTPRVVSDWNQVTTIVASQTWGTMRKRKPGIGI
jgi:hypothetical protein